MDKKQLTESDIRARYITPAIKWRHTVERLKTVFVNWNAHEKVD